MNAPLGAEAVLAHFIAGTEAAVKLHLAAGTEQGAGKSIADSCRRPYGNIILNPYKAQRIARLALQIGYCACVAFGAYARITCRKVRISDVRRG